MQGSSAKYKFKFHIHLNLNSKYSAKACNLVSNQKTLP